MVKVCDRDWVYDNRVSYSLLIRLGFLCSRKKSCETAVKIKSTILTFCNFSSYNTLIMMFVSNVRLFSIGANMILFKPLNWKQFYFLRFLVFFKYLRTRLVTHVELNLELFRGSIVSFEIY